MRFDSGVLEEEKGLREDVYVCLDLFRKNPPEITGGMSLLEQWLTFLSETDAGRIIRFLEVFPEFRECYAEVADFVRKPEELMEMYSDILRILDRNSERNMVTDLQGEVEELRGENSELKGENSELKGENSELKSLVVTLVLNKMREGKNLAEIAEEMKVEKGRIEGIYAQIQKLGADCSQEEIRKGVLATSDSDKQ